MMVALRARPPLSQLRCQLPSRGAFLLGGRGYMVHRAQSLPCVRGGGTSAHTGAGRVVTGSRSCAEDADEGDPNYRQPSPIISSDSADRLQPLSRCRDSSPYTGEPLALMKSVVLIGRTPISYISTRVRQRKEEQRQFNISESLHQAFPNCHAQRLLRLPTKSAGPGQPALAFFSTAQAAHFLSHRKWGA